MGVIFLNEHRFNIKGSLNKAYGYVYIPSHRLSEAEHKKVKEIKRELQKGYMTLLGDY